MGQRLETTWQSPLQSEGSGERSKLGTITWLSRPVASRKAVGTYHECEGHSWGVERPLETHDEAH